MLCCITLSAGSCGGRSAKGQTAKTSLCHVRFAADPGSWREFVVLFGMVGGHPYRDSVPLRSGVTTSFTANLSARCCPASRRPATAAAARSHLPGPSAAWPPAPSHPRTSRSICRCWRRGPPCLRHKSATETPFLCSFKSPIICSSGEATELHPLALIVGRSEPQLRLS